MIRAGRLSLDLFKACWSGHCLSVSVWIVLALVTSAQGMSVTVLVDSGLVRFG